MLKAIAQPLYQTGDEFRRRVLTYTPETVVRDAERWVTPTRWLAESVTEALERLHVDVTDLPPGLTVSLEIDDSCQEIPFAGRVTVGDVKLCLTLDRRVKPQLPGNGERVRYAVESEA